MKHILITGSGGAGKSTLARALSEKIDVPVIHLDYYYHQTDKDYVNNKQVWIEKVHSLLDQKSWIIEGNYSSTYEKRFALADTFIFLDIPVYVTMWSIVKRRYVYRNKSRPEMPEDWQEKLNWEFLRYVYRFNKDSRQKLVDEMEKFKHKNLEIHTFTSRKKAYKWLENIK
jgi:adenylate kinase family enzyme